VDQIETEAAASHQTPQFVLYAIPERDCDGMHSGGLSDVSAYEQWIDSLRAGIAGRPAVLIVEPDAIGMNCLSPSDRADRTQMLSYALETLGSDPNTWVYLHAGSSRLSPTDLLQPLIDVGIQHARGFALNVSSYGSIAEEERYGDALVRALQDRGIPGMHYVIDTSRNGVGRAPTGSPQALHGACNQLDRALGARPTPLTGHPSVDAYLWIKPPGETDGACFPGDPATGWYQSYALGLVRQALSHGIITRLQPPPR
jgi:endoglucanase